MYIQDIIDKGVVGEERILKAQGVQIDLRAL
jgi:hypothetical protein